MTIKEIVKTHKIPVGDVGMPPGYIAIAPDCLVVSTSFIQNPAIDLQAGSVLDKIMTEVKEGEKYRPLNIDNGHIGPALRVQTMDIFKILRAAANETLKTGTQRVPVFNVRWSKIMITNNVHKHATFEIKNVWNKSDYANTYCYGFDCKLDDVEGLEKKYKGSTELSIKILKEN